MRPAVPMRAVSDGSGGGGAYGLDGLGPRQAARVGLRFFLGVVSVLFGLLVLAFLSRSQMPDWQALTGEPGRPLNSLWRLWLNTAELAAASVAMEWARQAARRYDANTARLGLALGGLFAAGFLVGQLWVWHDFADQGYFVATSAAASFFYLLTGLHGLHLAGGLVAWTRATARAWRDTALERQRIGLCATYWHFLLALWLVLFALLASPPERLSALAQICGVG